MFIIDFKKKYQPFSPNPMEFIINESGYTVLGSTGVDLVDATAIVKFYSPSQKTFSPAAVTINDSTLSFSVPVDEIGIWGFIIEVYTKNQGTVKSAKFGYPVYEGIDPGDGTYPTYVSLYDTMTKAFDQWKKDMSDYNNTNNVGKETIKLMENALTAVNDAIASGTVDLETKDARTDAKGVVHATLKQRLDNEFKDLAKRIPTDIAVSGYETITTNDTLAGDVSGAVATGQTLVNLGSNMKYTTPSGAADVGILTPKQQIKISTHYTVLLQLKKSNLPAETSYIKFGAGFGEYYMFESSTTPLIFRYNTNETLISLVKTKSVIDNGAYSSLKIPIYFKDIPKDFETEIDIIIIEGDHTDKPLEFFEGLKSSELETVTSHGVNFVGGIPDRVNGPGHDFDGNYSFKWSPGGWGQHLQWDIPKGDYNLILGASKGIHHKLGKYSNEQWSELVYDSIAPNKVVSFVSDGTFVYQAGPQYADGRLCEFSVSIARSLTTLTPYQSSTTTLPKTVIRSLPNGVADTYDFDTQTLTRRCGEVVLNGSADITQRDEDYGTSVRFAYVQSGIGRGWDIVISNQFPTDSTGSVSNLVNKEAISGHSATSTILITIAKSKLATPDVAGFKAWLTANPTTVVYQLAEPTVEIVKNAGQLRSYDVQTTISSESVIPLKLSGNISVNYASTLSQTLATIDELTAENRNLKATIAELSENVAGINNFMYRMLAETGALEQHEETE